MFNKLFKTKSLLSKYPLELEPRTAPKKKIPVTQQGIQQIVIVSIDKHGPVCYH